MKYNDAGGVGGCTKIFSAGEILKIYPRHHKQCIYSFPSLKKKNNGKNRGWGMVLKSEISEQSSNWEDKER